MRLLVAVALCLGLLAACEEEPVAPESMHRRLGLRTPDDPMPRTTAGAGTSGHEERLLLDAPDPTCAPDPTTGGTTGEPQQVEPHSGGTTGGAPLGADSAPLPA